MAKIENDKYYTSNELAEYVVNKTKEVIGENNITEYLEPSAGSGVFLDYLDKPYLAYDLYPEDDRMVKQDYLELDLEYEQGRCIIGNPPYGRTMNLAVQFFKKAIQMGDYIAFILPISQLNNNCRIFEFDLIYSEDLGKRLYSDISVHCCFNIYKKPKIINKKPNYKLKDVEIRDYRRDRISTHEKTKKENFDYDIRICTFGYSVGKIVECEGEYVKESCIKINNKHHKDNILKLIKNADWVNLYNMTKSPNLCNWQVYKYIKEQIPEIN